MINEFCGINHEVFSTLLDAYQMIDWNMSWEEFLNQFSLEINTSIEKWKKEKVGIEEDE